MKNVNKIQTGPSPGPGLGTRTNMGLDDSEIVPGNKDSAGPDRGNGRLAQNLALCVFWEQCWRNLLDAALVQENLGKRRKILPTLWGPDCFVSTFWCHQRMRREIAPWKGQRGYVMERGCSDILNSQLFRCFSHAGQQVDNLSRTDQTSLFFSSFYRAVSSSFLLTHLLTRNC